jgi:hypothetical protein
MREVVWGVLLLGSCASPNTCDQSVIDDLAAIGSLSHSITPDSQIGHTVVPVTCSGGGTASMDVTVAGVGWSASFTFDTCTIAARSDVLTLTGTLTYDNNVNDNDMGTSSSLAIRGTVEGCPTTFDDTCALLWSSEPKEPGTNFNYFRKGTLCGRDFPRADPATGS